MAIEYQCPDCSQPLRPDKDSSDEYIYCLKCQKSILISSMAPKAPTIQSPSPVSQVPNNMAILPKTSGMAIASMIIGILGLLGGWFCGGIVLSLIAIIMGHVAYSKIQKAPTELNGKGLAIAGLTTGYVGLFLAIIVMFIFGTFAVSMAMLLQQLSGMLKQVGGSLP